MSAYIIVDVSVHDPEAYKPYTAAVMDTLTPFGGTFVVRGGAVETLEGSWSPQRAVMLEFPDVASARAWYHSSAYQAILPIRLANSTANFLAIVEGVPSTS